MKDVLIEAITKYSSKIEDHPAVERIDGRKGEGYFVDLKKGFQFDGQHGFGFDHKSEGKALLKSVKPCDDDCLSCFQNKG